MTQMLTNGKIARTGRTAKTEKTQKTEAVLLQRFIDVQRLLNQAAGSAMRLEEIFRQLSQQLLDWLQYDTVTLALLSADGQNFVQRFSQSRKQKRTTLANSTEAYVLSLLLHPSFKDITELCRFVDSPPDQPPTAHLAAPLGTLGVMVFSKAADTDFADWEVSLVEFICESLVLNLEKNRLLSEANQAEAVREAHRLKLQIFTSVSHELRTPLGLIRGYLSTLDERYEQISPAEQREFIQVVLEETETLTALLESLLDMARFETIRSEWQPQFQIVQPEELVNVAVRNFVSSGRPLRLEIAPDLPKIKADPMHIVQVIRNLLDNAVRYTPAECEVTLTMRLDNATKLLIEVNDRGPGIAPTALSHIFEKFYRVNPADNRRIKGLGLGLAIAKSLVEAHDGQIGVESTVGQGSTFWVRLPVYTPAE
jgi:K+-sensing histidine kinase KdpD